MLNVLASVSHGTRCLLGRLVSSSLASSPSTVPTRAISGATRDIFGYRERFRPKMSIRLKMKHLPKKNTLSFEANAFKDKPLQEWWSYDGFGRYRYRPHRMPNNASLRDLQRRRLLANHAEERMRINAIRKADLLPAELRRVADKEIHDVPRASSITRVRRSCVVTGRQRGIFHQFRVSRFIFRNEADHNRVSGAMRALWKRTVLIEP